MLCMQIDCGPGRNFRDKVCVADEHYVPSVLSVYGQDHARSSYSSLTYSFFPPDSHHPRSFPPGAMRSALQDMKCRNWIGFVYWFLLRLVACFASLRCSVPCGLGQIDIVECAQVLCWLTILNAHTGCVDMLCTFSSTAATVQGIVLSSHSISLMQNLILRLSGLGNATHC